MAARRLLAAALLLAPACRPSPGPPGASPHPPEVLTVAIRADVTGFYPNPPIVSEEFTITINRSLYECLLSLDPWLRLEPGLAERWQDPDDRTYLFELRPGVRFSDGRALTAADVAASLDAIPRHGWVTRDQCHAIQSVRVVDQQRSLRPADAAEARQRIFVGRVLGSLHRTPHYSAAATVAGPRGQLAGA